MATMLGSLLVSLGLESGAFKSGLSAAEKELRAATKRFEKVGQNMVDMGTKLSMAVTVPMIGIFQQSIKGFVEQEQAMAQVNAALASMGDASGKTAAELGKTADALELNSLFDADVILKQVTANLLTFGNVAGEQFDRAQQAAVDMATRLGGEPQAAAIMLGKALNDPIKGIAALTRVGVQFTDAQKAQIKAMTEAGDVAGAQGIILAEVEKQFRGAAQAAADVTPWRAAQVAIGQAMDAIGKAALPAVKAIAEAVKSAALAFAELPEPVQKGAVYVGMLVAAIGPLAMAIGAVTSALAPFIAGITTVAASGGPVMGLGFAVGRLLSIFNPWVVAIGAATTALVWMDRQVASADDKVEGFAVSVRDADKYIASLNSKATDGQKTQQAFGGAVKSSKDRMAEAAAQAKALIDRLYGVEAAAYSAARALAMQRATSAYNRINELTAEKQRIAGAGWQWGPGGLNEGRSQLILNRQLADAKKAQVDAGRQLLALDKDFNQRLANAPRIITGGANAASAAVGELNDKVAKTGGAAKASADTAKQAYEKLGQDIKSLMDRLFPEDAALEAYQQNLALLQQARLRGADAAKIDEAMRRLQIAGRDTTTQVGPDSNLADEQVFKIQDALRKIGKAANDNADDLGVANVRIAKSFKDMADQTLSALDRMASAVKGGGFLDILSAVIGLGMQLGSIGLFGKTIQANLSKGVPGFANGTNFAPGGMAIVGERGPELVNLPRGSQVIPNHELGGGMTVQVVPSPYFDVRVMENIGQAAPGLAAAGAAAGQRSMAWRQSRRVA